MNTAASASSVSGRTGAFSRRLGANLYDAILWAALWVLVAIPAAAYFTLVRHAPASGVLGLILRAAFVLTGLIYFTLGWSRGGQTPGMRAWRLQVYRHAKAPSPARAAARYGLALLWFGALVAGLVQAAHARYAAALPFCALFALAYLWIFVDPRAQTLHDRLCGTEVRYRPRSAGAGEQPHTEGREAQGGGRGPGQGGPVVQ